MRLQNIKLFTALLGVFAAVGLYGANFQPLMKLEYEYSRSGKIMARMINGVRQSYQYDKRGQLLGVYDVNGRTVEEYVYDPAGNILKKTLNGKTTTYTYDKANQLVSSVCDGKVTKYEYDAAGRLVKEGDKIYSYIGLDKIESVTEGGRKLSSFTYHIDGQLAARIGMESREDFTWDGLALIQRNNVNYVNEPAVTGGNPILADDSVLFNDMLGTTLGVKEGDQFASISRDAFGMTENTSSENFFTGKPHVGEMGYVFLFRNYRADQGKWQTSDPLGYPDGWNNLAYCNNEITIAIDFLGGATLFVETSQKYWLYQERNPHSHLTSDKQTCNVYEQYKAYFVDGILYTTSTTTTTIANLLNWLEQHKSLAILTVLGGQGLALATPGFADDLFMLKLTISVTTTGELISALKNGQCSSLEKTTAAYQTKQLTQWAFVKTVHSICE